MEANLRQCVPHLLFKRKKEDKFRGDRPRRIQRLPSTNALRIVLGGHEVLLIASLGAIRPRRNFSAYEGTIRFAHGHFP